MARRVFAHLLFVGAISSLSLAGGGAAWGHAELEESDPPYGARLEAAPAAVRLRFSEPLELAGSTLELSSADGRRFHPGHPDFSGPDHRGLVVSIPTLPPGTFNLTWWLIAVDGHEMGGELAFEVAPPPPTPSAVLASPAGAGSPESPAARAPAPREQPGKRDPRGRAGPASTEQATVRGLSYLFLASLFGGGAFLALAWPEGAAVRLLRRLLWLSLAGALLTTVAAIGLKGASLRGVSALAGLAPATMSPLLHTRFGRAYAAHAVALLLAVPLLLALRGDAPLVVRSTRFRAAGVLLVLGALSTRSLVGHASTLGPLGSAVGVVHFAAVSLWLGGLIVLSLAFVTRYRPPELPLVVARFSRLAFGAVSVLVLGGVTLLWLVVPDWGQLTSTPYGRTLLLKLALVGLLLGAAQTSRRFVQRHLLASPAGNPPAWRPLAMSVGSELVLAVAVLSVAAVLAGRPPPA